MEKKYVPLKKAFVFLIEIGNVQIFLTIDMYCFSFRKFWKSILFNLLSQSKQLYKDYE